MCPQKTLDSPSHGIIAFLAMNDDYLVLPIIINPARIIQAIIEMEWTETEACLEAHVNYESLRKLKAGRMPKTDVIRRLCKTLKVPVSEVVYGGSRSLANTDPDLVTIMSQQRKLLEAIRQAEEDIHSGEDSLTVAKRLSFAISHLQDARPRGFVQISEVPPKTSNRRKRTDKEEF